jgi:uncharacterized protein YbjT (DUF2867 family)
MKIIVTGSLGNISKPLAQALIAKGHEVTIISSSADKQDSVEAMGAQAAIGSVTDIAFLKTVFAGADAVYGMTPPNFQALDTMDYYRSVASAYAEAVKSTGVKRFVYLSSYGADLDRGSGMILGSHYGEGILGQLADVNITFLRPGYFYYNLFHFLGMIKHQGMIGTNFGGEDKLVMVSPFDIATAAAEELINASSPNKIRYIVSDERSCNEVAGVLGAAIGKPDLQWHTFTDEQVAKAMAERGMPQATASLLVELGAAIHTGTLRQDYEQHKGALAPTKLEDFVPEFVAAYLKTN